MSDSAPIVDRIRIIPRPNDFLDRNVGSSGEVFFNRATNSLRVYSGKDRSGFEIARADLSNVDSSLIVKPTDLGSISIESFSDVMYMPNPLPEDGQVLVWRTDHWMNETLNISGGGASVDVSDTAPAEPESGNLWLDTNTGKLYIYYDDGDTAQWIQPAVPSSSGSGGTSSNASTLEGEAGSYYLNYNNFTNVPTSILDFGISDGTSGQVLATDGAGNFTFINQASGGGGGGVDLTALSVSQQTASGNGTLTYNNLTGVFTYTPPDLSSYLTSYTETDTLATVTARGAATSDAVTINNTLTVNELQTGGAGNPTLTSASTLTLDAADAVVVVGSPFRLPSLTQTQINALTPVDGDMVFNSTTGVPQIYASGAGGWNNAI